MFYSIVVINIIFSILGVICFEYVWYQSRRHRSPIPELDALMPAYRRIDAHRWAKWRFYFGSLFLWQRGIWALLYMVWHCCNVRLLMCCHDTRKPVTGCRKFLVKWESRFIAWTWMVFPVGVWCSWEEVAPEKVNYYEEWLGTREE